MNGMIDNTQKPKTKMNGWTGMHKTKDRWIGGWTNRFNNILTM